MLKRMIPILVVVFSIVLSGCSSAESMEYTIGLVLPVSGDLMGYRANVDLKNRSWDELTDAEIRKIVFECSGAAEKAILSENDTAENYIIHGINPDTNEEVFVYNNTDNLILFNGKAIPFTPKSQ